MAAEIDALYADNPWGDISMMERYPMYLPEVIGAFRRAMKWGRVVTNQIDLKPLATRQVVLTRQIDGAPNFNVKQPKSMMLPVSTFSSFQRKTVQTEYHADKVAWHTDDDLFNFLNLSIDANARQALGRNMAIYFDYLYRNAALESVYKLFANSGSDFTDLTAAGHLFDLRWVAKIILGLEYEDIVDADTGIPSILCITSPGVLYDIRMKAGGEWEAINSFSEAGRNAMLAYGIQGVYMGVGWASSTANVLWNCGNKVAQHNIVEQMNTLDGVAAGANTQGWTSAQDGIKNYVALDAVTDLAVGDIITLHRTLTSDHGVSDGVDYREGTADIAVIAAINGNNISLVKPWLKDGYTTLLAGGQYGYVTKAQHVHLSSFVAATGAIYNAVAQPPLFNEAPAIDDMGKQHRLAWDCYAKAELVNHEAIRNVYTLGTVVAPGQMTEGILIS